MTELWHCLHANSSLLSLFLEYIKLTQIAFIYVLGFIEDKKAFSSVTFLKEKLCNRLDGEHLGLVVEVHNQSVYTLTLFPYKDFQEVVEVVQIPSH